MGLDVYLYSREQAEQDAAHEKAWDALWARFEAGEITEEERSAQYKELPKSSSGTDVPSLLYPDHLFNRRYLRSSYNDSGFNHAVPDFLATGSDSYPKERGSLYWIFEPMGREWDGDAGILTASDLPLLAECKKRALTVAEELRASDRLRVMTLSPSQLGKEWMEIDDAKALSLVREQAAQKHMDGWWSNRDLNWYGGDLALIAAVPGITKVFFGDGAWPAMHLIYRANDEGFESYVQSAEITAEFCDEAVTLIERDGSALMSWSG